MSSAQRLLLVLLCFFLSGLTALIYQTAWTREFAFVFGTSELAVATVLAAYMGGLAAGSAAAGRFAGQLTRPVLVYGVLELGVAVTALLVPVALRGATLLYGSLFAGRIDSGGIGSGVFYVTAAFVVLGLPTAFMGATLPLLARHAVRTDAELGPRIGLLYSLNTVGAVFGTILAAFVLLPRLGLGATVGVAVATNAAIFGVAALIARGAEAVPAADATARTWSGAAGRWILPLMLASGVASFTYEVLWTRLLGHVLGGSVYAFATMLASFLIGIAGGAAIAARRATSPRAGAVGFAVAQLGTAVLALAAFAAADALPRIALALRDYQPFGDALVAGMFLLPATLCIGATFPFAVRVLARGEEDAGPASARVYAWNTVGAIVGALGAGFFVVPALGFAETFRAAALLNLALAGAAAWLASPRVRGLALAAAGLAVAFLLVAPGTPWNVLRFGPLSPKPASGAVSFFSVGRSTTVLVLEQNGQWKLRTNGLPEAGFRPTGHPPSQPTTARWLSALPLLARPDARSMLVIGLGGGIAVQRLSPALERIDVVELEPEVVEANRVFGALRESDPLADPRLRVIENDARGALNLSDAHYDVVVSQPSHPWTAGASHLYTREFFALVRERLAPGGAFLQWIGPAFVDEELLRILVATMRDVFPHVVVHQAHQQGGILLLASDAELDPTASVGRARTVAPQLFGSLGVLTPEDAAASQLLDDAGTAAFAEGAPLNRDRRNYLQMRSPKLRIEGRGPLMPEPLLVDLGLVPEPAASLDRGLLVERLAALGFVRRASAEAERLEDPVDRLVARARIALRTGQHQQSRGALRRALELAPTHPRARALAFELDRVGRGGLLPEADAGPAERLVLAAQAGIDADERDLGTWEALDAQLARIPPGAAFGAAAARLRVAWRANLGGEVRLREALEQLDRLVARRDHPDDLIARARLGATLRDPVVALSSIDQWRVAFGPAWRTSGAVPELRALVEALPAAGRWEGWRRATLATLSAPASGASPPPRRAN